jgi:hypothetical protein
LTTDKREFVVHLESEGVSVLSDSSFVLLPEHPKVVTYPEIIVAANLAVYELNTVRVWVKESLVYV